VKSLSGSTLRDVLRRSFGFLPAVGILAGLVLGFVLPVVDRALRIDFGIFSFTERDSARSLLETIASVTVSVAGVGFSVTIVAFTLASQQLSPRVLRTFQSDRLSQALLGAFLGTFAFCLVVLATLDAGGEALPDLSLAVAVLGAIASFALFVAFIQNASSRFRPRRSSGAWLPTVRRRSIAGSRLLSAPTPMTRRRRCAGCASAWRTATVSRCARGGRGS